MNKQSAVNRTPWKKAIVIVFVICILLFLIFRFTSRQEASDSEKAEKLLKEWRAERAELSKIPKKENAWTYYEEAAEIIRLIERDKKSGIIIDPYTRIREVIKDCSQKEIDDFLTDYKSSNPKIFKLADKGFENKIGNVKHIVSYKPVLLTSYKIEYLPTLLLLSGISQMRNDKPLLAAKRLIQSIHIHNEWAFFIGFQGRNIVNNELAIEYLLKLISKERNNRELQEYVLNKSEKINTDRKWFRGVLIAWIRYNRVDELEKIKYSSWHCDSLGEFRDQKIASIVYLKQLKYFNRFLIKYAEYSKEPYNKAITLMKKTNNPDIPFVPNIPYIKESLDIFSLKENYKTCIEIKTRIDAIRILAALNLYRLDNGEYPGRLEMLVPKYLKELPKDQFAPDGKFVYKNNDDGEIKFYSVGPDMKDDNGKEIVEWNNSDVGDIVFAGYDI